MDFETIDRHGRATVHISDAKKTLAFGDGGDLATGAFRNGVLTATASNSGQAPFLTFVPAFKGEKLTLDLNNVPHVDVGKRAAAAAAAEAAGDEVPAKKKQGKKKRAPEEEPQEAAPPPPAKKAKTEPAPAEPEAPKPKRELTPEQKEARNAKRRLQRAAAAAAAAGVIGSVPIEADA